MSNLKLPDISYSNLVQIAGDDWKKIAYETYAKRVPNYERGLTAVYVRHFNSTIAIVLPDVVVVDNHGYHTRTTANRLNEIVFSNTGHHIGITKGVMVFREAITWKESELYGETRIPV